MVEELHPQPLLSFFKGVCAAFKRYPGKQKEPPLKIWAGKGMLRHSSLVSARFFGLYVHRFHLAGRINRLVSSGFLFTV